MERRVRTTALRWVRPPMATSMRPLTGTPTQTPGVVGKVQARTPRSTTHPATPVRAPPKVLPVPVAGEGRKRAADHRPSTVEAEAGNPESQALAAQKAGAVAVAGEAAGEPYGANTKENTFRERRC